MGAGHGDEPSHEGMSVVLAQPLPSDACHRGCGRRCRPARHRCSRARHGRTGAGRGRSPPRCGPATSGSSGPPGSRTDPPGSRGPTTPTAGSRDAGSTRRRRAGPRTAGCRLSDTACRCCRAGRSPACAAIGPSSEPKPINGVPRDASRITGKSAGKLVPSSLCLRLNRGGRQPARRRQQRQRRQRRHDAAWRHLEMAVEWTIQPAHRMNGG